jgi:endogenous inhibitor of DNA gyrase (YacG/DUF329 family)
MPPTIVPCPTCGREVPWTDESSYRPFCSARCRLIDLGEWLDEGYRISDATDAPSDDPPPSDDGSQTH